MNRYYVQRSDDGSSLGDGRDHTWDVIDRVTGYSVRNTDSRVHARHECREYNIEANRIAATPCARAMGCLCAAHARGAAADVPCDATEERTS